MSSARAGSTTASPVTITSPVCKYRRTSANSKGQKLPGLANRRAKGVVLYNTPAEAPPIVLPPATETSVTPDALSTPRVWSAKPVIATCVAGVSTVCSYAPDIGHTLSNTANQLQPLVDYRHALKVVFLTCSLGGIAIGGLSSFLRHKQDASTDCCLPSMAPWKKLIDIIVVLSLIGAAAWIYFALVNRAAEIKQLTEQNATVTKAATDNATALTQSQQSLAQTTAALKFLSSPHPSPALRRQTAHQKALESHLRICHSAYVCQRRLGRRNR